MIQDIFIIGANGNVGSTLVKQIYERGDTDPGFHRNPTRIVGVASVNSFYYDSLGLTRDFCYSFANEKLGTENYDLSELIKCVQNSNRNGSSLTFIDVTAAREPMKDFHLRVIDETPYGIVTSNKNPLTMVDSATFAHLVKNVCRYGFRCSVMAGANALDEIMDFRDLNDPVRSIQGCFSGTNGYICSELENKVSFSEIVRKAKNMGYTEPHPGEDLSGKDVAKKILILTRTAGFDVNIDDVQIDPLIPHGYLDISDVSEFMSRLSELDNYFSELVSQAKKRKEVLKYVASMSSNSDGRVQLYIGPKLVKKNSPLGALEGTLNKIVIITNTYTPEKPCIIEAPGAGLEVTAQNVRRDLLNQLSNRTVNFRK